MCGHAYKACLAWLLLLQVVPRGKLLLGELNCCWQAGRLFLAQMRSVHSVIFVSETVMMCLRVKFFKTVSLPLCCFSCVLFFFLLHSQVCRVSAAFSVWKSKNAAAYGSIFSTEAIFALCVCCRECPPPPFCNIFAPSIFVSSANRLFL